MKALFWVLLFSLLTPLDWAQRQSSSSSAQESKLIALENAWNQAQLHHDAKALDTLVGDRFVYTDYDGTVVNKARFLADIRDPEFRASLIANEEVKVDLYPNAAVVTGTYHTRGTYKSKPFDHYGRFTDTWIYQNDQWQCVASHTTLTHKRLLRNSAVPPGLGSFLPLSPALKRWAKLDRPSGAGFLCLFSHRSNHRVSFVTAS